MDDGYVDELEEQVDDSRPEERELAEDAQWKKIQKNTFTRWSNQHLKSQKLVINDLQYDLSDGLKLVELISVLASHPFKHVNKRPTFRTQKLENVTMVLKFLEESEQMRLVNIDSSDIVDCRLKLILGLIWTLILHYSISMPMWEGEEPIAKDAKGKGPTPKQRVLSWLNSKMPDKPVKNLTNDWNSGIAIGALVDALAPGLCPDWSDWNPKDALKNAKEAMELAEKWLDVAQLLRPEEMVDPRIDEKALMTYLSQFPQAKLKEGAPLRPRTNPARVRAYGPGLEAVGNAIKAPARFTVDAFSAGIGKLEVVVLNPKGASEPVSVEPKPNQKQIHACCYTPSIQGEHRVIIKYASKEVPNSPYCVMVDASAGDPSKVTASGPGIERTGNVIGKRTFFNVFLNDAGVGNIETKIRDPQMRDEIVKPLVTKQNDNTFLVEYSPIVAGPHSVEVLFAGQPIPHSPFAVEVSGAPPPGSQGPVVAAKKAHPLESHPIMQGNGARPGGAGPADKDKVAPAAAKKATPGPAYVTGRGVEPKGLRVNEPTEFTVHTENAGTAKLQVKVVGPGGMNEQVKVVAQDAHTHVCQYKPTRIGQYVIMVEYGPVKVQKSPFKVDVAGACKSKVIAYGPGLKTGVVNSPAPFTVDSQGSPGELGFAIEGPSQAQLTCNDNGDGSAAVHYVPTAPGEYAVHVLCNKEDIQGSPFMAQIQDVSKGKFDAAKVKAFGPGLETTGVQVGKETNFTVETKEAGEVQELRTWCIDSHGKEVPIKVVERTGSRSYTCTYTATVVGKHTVYISYGNIQIKGSPYKVTVSTEASGAQVTASGPGLESATVGKPTVFSIDTKKVGGDTAPITVEITTADKRKLNFQTKDKDGVREIQYLATGTVETRYTIQVNYRGKPVSGSPFQVPVHVTSSAKVAARASGRGIQPRGIRVNEEVFFNVHTENCPPNGAVKAKLIGPGGIQQTVTITKVTETLYKCVYRATKVGSYVITVEYAGTAVTNSPFKVQIDADKQSKIRAYGPGLESAVVDTAAKFTVDSNGDRSQLVFNVTGPGPAKVESRDNGDGTVAVQYLPSRPGEHAVNITASDEHIPGSPFMVVASEQSALKIDTSKVKVSGPGIEPTGNVSGRLTSFTIDTRPLKQKVPVDVRCFSKDGVVVPVQLVESTDGTHKCSYTPLLPQPHLIYVSCTGIDLPLSPYKVMVGEGKANRVKASGPGLEKAFASHQTSFTIDTTEVGSDTTPITVDIKLSKGQQVPFSSKVIRPGVCEVSYSVSSKTNDSLTITIHYEGEALKDSPFKVPVDATTPVEPAKVTVTGRGVVPKGVRANEIVTFKVHTDRPAPGDTLKTKVIGPGGIPVAVETKKLTADTYECQYSSPREGSHIVTVDFNNKPADKSPFKVQIGPQKTTKIKAFGPGLEGGLVGLPAVFTVNPNGETPKLDFRVEGPKEAKITCQDNGDGTIGVQYVPVEKGEYAVHVLANGDDIPLSPFMVDIGPAPDKSASTDNVKAHGPGLEPTGVVTGKPTQFTVDATRAPAVKPVLVKCYDADGVTVPVTSTETGNKVSTYQYCPSKPGKHTVSVSYGGVPVPKSPFVVQVGVEQVGTVLAFGPGLETAEMNSPTSFTVDATATTNGTSSKIQHSVVDDKNRKVPTKVTELAPGKQEISYTPVSSVGSTVKVHVSYDSKPLPGSPFTVPVTPKKDKHVTATGRGIQPVGLRTNENVSFNVESDSPIAAKDLKPKLIGPGGAVEPISVSQVTPNKLQCSYTPTKVGPHSVVADMEGKPIEKSPFKVEIAPKTKSPVKAFGSGLEGGQAKVPAIFYVATNGETGQLGFAVEGPSKATLTCKDEGNGRIQVEYVPEVPGEYAIRVLCNDSDIQDSPFMVPIIPAAPTSADLTKAKVYGPGVESKDLPTDKETSFIVDTKNCGPVVPAVAKCYDKQGNTVPVKATKQPNGLEKFAYVPKKDGEHTVQVLVDNKQLPKSPFKVNVGEPEEQAVTPQKGDKHVTATGRGIQPVGLRANEEVSFNVESESPISAKDLKPKLIGPGGAVEPISVSQVSPNKLQCSYAPTKVGPHSIVAEMEGKPVDKSPFKVEIAPKTKSPVKAFGSGLEGGQAKVPAIFFVATNGEIGQLGFAVEGPSKATLTCKDEGNGRVQVEYVPEVPGEYAIRVLCNDSDIQDSPFMVPITPAAPTSADLTKAKVYGPGVESKDLPTDKETSFTVDTKNCGPVAPAVAKCYDKQGNTVPVKATKQPNGLEKFAYVPKKDGEHTVQVLVDNKEIPNSPFKVGVEQSEPSTAAGALAYGPGLKSIEPNSEEPVSFFVDLRLAEDSPGAVPVLAVLDDQNKTIPSALKSTPTPGLFEACFEPAASPHSETFHPKVTVDSKDIPGSPFSVPVKPHLKDRNAPGVLSDLKKSVQAGQPQTFRVQLKDGIKDEPVVTISEAGPNAPEVPSSTKRLGPALFQVDYRAPTTPGQCVVTARCQDKPLEGTPVSVSVVDAAPVPLDDVVVEGLAPIAELGQPQSLTVRAPADKLSNPELVDVHVISPSAKQIPITKETVPEGTRVTFVPKEEGPHAIGCWVQDQPVNETPCIVQAAPRDKIPALLATEPVPATLSVTEAEPKLDKPCTFLVDTGAATNVEDIAVKVLAPDRRSVVPVDTKQLPEGLACSFLPEHPGQYSLCASVNNRPIDGSPVTVVVPDQKPVVEHSVQLAHTASLNQPNTPYNALEEAIKEMKHTAVETSKWPQSTPTHPSAKVRIYGDGLTNVCAAEKARFTIDSREAPSAPIGVTVEGPGEAVISCVDNGDGTCGVEYEAPVPGLYTVNVLYDNVHVPDSPVVVPVYPRDSPQLDLAAISVFGPGLEPLGVFKDCFARFTVDTSKIDSVGVGVVKATVQSPSGKKTAGLVENLGDGRHLVRFTPTEEGPHTVRPTYEGLPVGHKPFVVPVKPGYDAKRVTASGPGLHSGRVAERTTFIVDLDGAGPGSLGLAVEGPADTEIQCHDNGDGTCLVEYTPSAAGDYELSVRFNDDDITDSPFRVRVLAPVAPAAVKTAGPKPLAKLGRPNHFPVDCTTAGVAPLVATVSQPQAGQQEKPAIVKQIPGAPPGTFDVCFEPEALGPCTVRVNYGDQPVQGSPFLTEVVPPVQTDKVRVLGDGIEPASGVTLASMPAVFHVDTTEAGPNADVNVGVVNPNGEPIPLRIEARPDGLFTCEYRTHDVGDHKISVDVDGKPLPKSPYTVKVVPTGDAEKCTLAESTEKVIRVDQESVFKVSTKEAGDGQITCTVKKIERRQVGQLEQVKVLDSISVEVQQHPDGISSVHYVPKEEGEYLVEVKFGGRTIPGGKFVQKATRVTFEQVTETVTRASRTNLASASPVATSAFHGVDFEINSKDKLPKDLEAKVVQPSGNLETVPIEPSDEAGHNIKVAYQPSERGVHQLQVSSCGRPIKGSPFQFFVDTKGEGRVSAYGPGLSSGNTNERAEFTVITKDAGPGGLSLVVEGPSRTEISCQDNGDGTFAVSYVPRAPGDYSIIIKFRDQPIAGSPFIAKITGESVQRSQVALGHASEIPLRIPSTDITALTAELTTPSRKKSPCVIKKLDNGALGVSFTPKEIGEHLVSVFEKGVDIPGSPFTVTVTEHEVGDASKVKLSGAGLETGLANQINEFTIDTRQAGYGSLNISIEGPSKAEIDCKDNEDGTCTVNYLPTEPGNYVINVVYAGKNVPGSPFTVPVRGDKLVASETQKKEHVQEAARTTTVGGTCEINLKMNDNVAVKELRASVHTPSGFSEPCDIEDAGNGNIRLKFVAREVGVHRVSVLYRDRHIPGSPFQFTVGAAPLGGPNTVTATGPGLERGVVKSPNEFSIYTREAGAGNISVVMEGPSKAELQFQESEDKGSCEVSYRVALPGDYVCSIKFNGEHIVGSPFNIRVVADDDSVKPIVAQAVSSSFSDIIEQRKELGRLVSITVRPDDGETAKLEASVETPSGTIEPAIIQQIGDGQYGVKFTPRESGIHMVVVENHGRPVPGSPFRIPVGDYRADPGMVHASGDGLKRAFVDKKAHFFVNTTNAGSGSLNVAIDGPSKVKMNCHETEEGYEFTYVATAAGSYLISITYGGNYHIVGSPFLAQVEGVGPTEDRPSIAQHSQVEIDASDKKCVSQYSERPTSKPDKVICQGLGLKQAKLNSVNSFFVDASQAGYDILFVGVGGPVRPCEEVVVKHVGNNQFTVDYVIKEPGNHIIMVRWGDRDVPGSPFMVHVD